MASSQYARWPVTRLKRVLSERGATTSGRKEQLVERLEAYDRNFNFAAEPIFMPQPDAVNWPQSGFQQLQPMHVHLLPKITEEQIEAYFIFRLAGDKHAASDVKALVKGKLIKDADRVLACSILMQGGQIYFSGIVAAAMKKSVRYDYFIVILMTTPTYITA